MKYFNFCKGLITELGILCANIVSQLGIPEFQAGSVSKCLYDLVESKILLSSSVKQGIFHRAGVEMKWDDLLSI